jgi:hypothetical protein
VSRAARLEPKTPAGEVYASEAFAALAAVENVTDFTCDYVKQFERAKHYGTFPTFVLSHSKKCSEFTVQGSGSERSKKQDDPSRSNLP